MSALTETAVANPRRGVALALGSAFLWSLTGVMLRFVEGAGTWQIIAIRSLVMAAAVALYMAVRYRASAIRAALSIGRAGVVGGVCLGLGFTCYISAIQATAIANVAILTGLVPIAASVLGFVVLGERVPRRTWLFAVIAVTGAGAMVVEGVVFGGWLGNLFALGATACQAAYTVIVRRGRGVDMLPTVGLACVVSAAIALAFAGDLAVSLADATLIGVTGLVSTLIGNTLFALSARYVTAGVLALLSMLEIVLSPLWVAVFVGELPTRWAMAGGVVVIGAVLAQVHDSRRRAGASS